MSPRALVLSLLVLAAVAGGVYLAVGTDSAAGTVDTIVEQDKDLQEDSASKSQDPAKQSDESSREQMPGQPGEARSKVGATRTLAKGDSLVRVRFLQKGKVLAHREVRLQSLSGPGSTKHETDADGRLVVEDLGSGRYRFAVQGQDMPRGAALPAFRLRDQEEKDLGDLEVPSPASVTGRLRGEGGVVIVEAQVKLGKKGFSDFLNEDDGAPTTISELGGEFFLGQLAPGSYVLRVDHPAWLRLDRPLEIKDGEEVDLGVLELGRGRSIRGQVVDQENKPIAGVDVQAEIQTRIGTSLVRGYSDARSVRTDKQGRFSIGGLGASTRLLLHKNGYQEKRDLDVDLDKGFVRVQLLAERGIYGRVTGFPKGRGAAIKVHVAEHAKVGGGVLDLYLDRQTVRCDAEGSFRITGLDKGDYRLVAALDDYGFSKKHKLSLGNRSVTGIDLILMRGGELVVRALDARQAPIVGARVVVEAVDPLPKAKGRRVRMRGQGSIRLRGRTDDQGVARIQGVFEGHARLSVQHDRYLGSVSELDLVAGRQEKLVHLSLGGWIEGMALDSQGYPVKGAELVVARASGQKGGKVFNVDVEEQRGRDSGPMRSQPMICASDGSFRSEALAPGLYEVWFKSTREILAGGAKLTFDDGEGKKPGRVEVQVVEGRVSKIQLKKPVAGTLRGVVTYKGFPANKAQVFAWPVGKDSFDARQARAGKDGSFRLADLEPGAWQYCAKPEKGGVATPVRRLEVPAAGGEIHRNLRLGGGLIRGRCRMPAGRPLPRGLVAILEEGSTGSAGGKKQSTRKVSIMMTADSNGKRKLSQMVMRPPTDPEPVPVKRDGSFEIEYVAAGPWKLVIEAKGNVRMAAKDCKLAEDQTLDLGLIDLEPVFAILLQVQDSQSKPISMGTLAVYRKRKGQSAERVWGGLVQDGKVRIPGLPAGDYRLQFSKIDMTQGGKTEPQESLLTVHPDGSATGTNFRFH